MLKELSTPPAITSPEVLSVTQGTAAVEGLRPHARHRRLVPLDGLRGLAVLIVFIYHMGGGASSRVAAVHWFGLVVRQGWTGVTLFFILSGFLITGILWDSRGEEHWWRNFYTRRVLRIFPLYYASLLIVLIGAAYVGTFHVALSRIWSPVLFLQDVPGRAAAAIVNTGSPMPLEHFWSLAVEEQFYLVWPFLLLLPRTKRAALHLCATIFLVSEALWIGQWFTPVIAAYSPLVVTRAGEMAAGAWLAIAYRTPLWEKLRTPARIAAPAGLIIFFLVTLLGGRPSALNLPAITLSFAALLVLSLKQGVTAKMLSMRLICWLGTISYGIYVYHVLLWPLFRFGAKSLAGSSAGVRYSLAKVFVTTAGTLLVSWLSFRYFERPFLRRKRRFPTAGPVDMAPTH